ncbi:hypothetical protein [Vibrio parahaemolyticus]
MAKKFDRLGLSSISMTCAVIASPKESLYQCALCILC